MPSPCTYRHIVLSPRLSWGRWSNLLAMLTLHSSTADYWSCFCCLGCFVCLSHYYAVLGDCLKSGYNFSFRIIWLFCCRTSKDQDHLVCRCQRGNTRPTHPPLKCPNTVPLRAALTGESNRIYGWSYEKMQIIFPRGIQFESSVFRCVLQDDCVWGSLVVNWLSYKLLSFI